MDIRSVDLNLLVALDALLSERNVTRAAARLHLSQSAMSASLARLRTLFADPLLLRTAHGMLPTTKGEQLATPVKQVLGEIGRLVQQGEPFDPALTDATFTIAASDYVEYAILPQLVDFLEARAPRARLAVRQMDFTTVRSQLETGDVDLAILGAGNAPPDMRSRPLFAERFVCVVRRDHPGVKQGMTLDTFCTLSHVLVSQRGGSFTAQTDEALATLGRSRDVRLAVPHFMLVPEILARTDMIAVLPERLARGYAGRLQVFDLPVDLQGFAISQVWHERSHRDPALVWLRQSLVELMGGVASPGAGPAKKVRRVPSPPPPPDARS